MANRRYSDELKERAVRLALEQKPRPIAQVARDLGVEAESLRVWVRRAEADMGKRPGQPFFRSNSRFPLSQAGMPQHSSPFSQRHIDAVLFEHLHGVHPTLRLVPLHVAGLKEHGVIPPALVRQARALRPGLEGRVRELGKQLASIDAHQLLHEPAVNSDPVHHVREPKARARSGSGSVRVFEHSPSRSLCGCACFRCRIAS